MLGLLGDKILIGKRCLSSCHETWDKQKFSETQNFSLNLPSFLFYNIADSSSIRDASLCGLVVEHRSAKTEGLRFHSSWGLRIFSLSHARDKTKKHLLLFSYRAQNLQSFLFYLDPICDEKYVPLWCCSIELLSHIWKFLIVFF